MLEKLAARTVLIKKKLLQLLHVLRKNLFEWDLLRKLKKAKNHAKIKPRKQKQKAVRALPANASTFSVFCKQTSIPLNIAAPLA